ncbi:hypothetical protein HDU97_004545 [Phlyctochytrium planicorne]|nr:hypothetical protein HDU97_004545 [Phlyctochytrium planicorne]
MATVDDSGAGSSSGGGGFGRGFGGIGGGFGGFENPYTAGSNGYMNGGYVGGWAALAAIAQYMENGNGFAVSNDQDGHQRGEGGEEGEHGEGGEGGEGGGGGPPLTVGGALAEFATGGGSFDAAKAIFSGLGDKLGCGERDLQTPGQMERAVIDYQPAPNLTPEQLGMVNKLKENVAGLGQDFQNAGNMVDDVKDLGKSLGLEGIDNEYNEQLENINRQKEIDAQAELQRQQEMEEAQAALDKENEEKENKENEKENEEEMEHGHGMRR